MKTVHTSPALSGLTLILLSSLLTLSACDKKTADPIAPTPTDPGAGTTTGQSGYVVGKATDPQGNPLPRATVFVDHTVFSGDGPEVKTAADGSYKVQLTAIAGEWIAKSYLV